MYIEGMSGADPSLPTVSIPPSSSLSSAEVSVVLRNRGVEAYLPDKYGDKICVVRTLKVDGTGSYELKGESGGLLFEEIN